MDIDYVVIGGGLVGLSTAYQLLRSKPGASVVVLEKEGRVAAHQSTRNSGVVHTGVYYTPGSYKARLCVAGRKALIDFAEENGVSFSMCGKLIVATSPNELDQLHVLHKRAVSNGVDLRLVSRGEMLEKEPHVSGVGGLWVPHEGVVDFAGFAAALEREIHRLGGAVLLNTKLVAATREGSKWSLEGSSGNIQSSFVVNCAGLHSDKVARLFGAKTEGRIVPFRGEYYVLRESARSLCRALIYPVPDPRFPFLGVHFTRRFDGSVECGPNAVLALAREGYSWRDCSLGDLRDMASFVGFRRLIGKHWSMGLAEIYRSFFKAAFVRALQRLIPSVGADDLEAGGAGVRAQYVNPDGSLESDFRFEESPGVLHVLNAPSPAATSCLAIGEELCRRFSAAQAA